mmetsp:Transcript_3235/g.20081  ORF Transcript_3235/g.20081 Transcript_3235/m.20081 type:complete len:827 (+) Transcript_3235:628-3108(+)
MPIVGSSVSHTHVHMSQTTMVPLLLAVLGCMAKSVFGEPNGDVTGLPTGQYSVEDYLSLAVCNRRIRDAVGRDDFLTASNIILNGRDDSQGDCAGGKAFSWYMNRTSFLNVRGPTTFRGFYEYYEDRTFLDTLAKRYICSSNAVATSRGRRILEAEELESIDRDQYCSTVSVAGLHPARIREGMIKVPQVIMGLVIGLSESEKSIVNLETAGKDVTRYVFAEGYAFTVGKNAGENDSSLFYTMHRRGEVFGTSNNEAVRIAYQNGLDAINNANFDDSIALQQLKIDLTKYVQEISARYVVTLAQTIERYAVYLDDRTNDGGDGNEGDEDEGVDEKRKEEMQLFYYGIAPYVDSLDKEVAKVLATLMTDYDRSQTSDQYCRIRHIMEYVTKSMSAYGVNEQIHGTYRRAGSCSENQLLKIPNGLALPIGSKWHTPSLEDGIPRLATDTKDYALLSYDVCDIKESVMDKQWEKAIEIYLSGKNSPEKSLYSYAVKAEPESVTWRRFSNAFGSETFIDDHLKEYFCSSSSNRRTLLEEGDFAEGANHFAYCSGYEGNPMGYRHASKTQAIPKAVQNWIGIFKSTLEFEKAVKQVEIGETMYGARPSASHSLSEAYLFYTGARPGDDCSAYATTDKRASNFGVGDNQRQILEAYKRADNELQKSNPSIEVVRQSYEEVTSLHLIVYAKSVTRYAYFLDEAAKQGVSPYKYGAEGKTFFKIIMPYVSSVDPQGAAKVTEIFADENAVMEANQNYYCQVEEVMNCFVRSMSSYGVSVQRNYGTFNLAEADGITCSFTCHGRTLDYSNPDNAGMSTFLSLITVVASLSFFAVM